MEEKEINPIESLAIINQMINRAQNRISENGFLFIFWGWLVFISSIVFYILFQLKNQYAGLAWLTMPLGGIFTAIYVIRSQKKETVKSHIDDYIGYVSIAFALGIMITIFNGNIMQISCYPVVIMLYAIMTFIFGDLLKYKPLIICGLLSFPISFIAFHVTFETQILLIAASVLISYIIPGHMLMAKFKSQKDV